MYTYPLNDYRNYLEHHGVKGQKHGVRNAEWYPIDAWKAHLARTRKTERNGNSKSSQKQGFINVPATIALNVGLKVAQIAITAGIEHVADKGTEKKLEKLVESRTGKKDKKTGFYKREDNKPIEEDLVNVNPVWNRAAPNANNNCVNCSLDVEMRNRGYNTFAKLQKKPVDGLKITVEAFPGAKVTNLNSDVTELTSDYSLIATTNKKAIRQATNLAKMRKNTEHADKVYSALSKEKDSRGSLFVLWGPGGGHALNYEVKGGKVKVIDGQVNKVYDNEEDIKTILKGTWSVQYIRTDNKKFDAEQIKKYVA